jgi:NAD(P)H dehydrogenase (quinone)
MNHLIVLAHPNPASLCAAICSKIADVSSSNGHKVEARDLYSLNFNPVLSAEDFKQLRAGATPKDIAVEQLHVKKADVITLVFPLWWTGYPAILKGWIDRVLQNGFAFSFSQKDGIVPRLTGKKVQLITTMGSSVDEYEENGLMDAMAMTMGDNVWSFCGCEDAGLIAIGEVPGMTEGERKMLLQDLVDSMPEDIFGPARRSQKKPSRKKTVPKTKSKIRTKSRKNQKKRRS